jgi:hypothetical protein
VEFPVDKTQTQFTYNNTREERLASQYIRATAFAGLNWAKILVVEYQRKSGSLAR